MRQAFGRITTQRWLALVGIAILVFGIALVEGRLMVGPLPLDAITVTVPLALLMCFPYVRAHAPKAVTDTGIVMPALVFLSFALLSCVVDSLNLETFLTFTRYLSYLLLTAVIAVITRDAFARRFTMWVVALAGAATVAYGGWWYASEYLRALRAAIAAGVEVAPIALRVVSTFQNANFYSEFLVLLLAVLGYLIVTEDRLLRWIAAFIAVLSGVMLMLTYTRGSWFGFFGAAAVVALVIVPRRAWVVFGVPVLITLISPTVQERLASFITLEGSAGFRLKLWRIAGAAIAAAPITGSGIGTFYDAFTEAIIRDPALAIGFAFYGAHNSYFTLFAETGVFGGAAFVVLIFAILRVAFPSLLDSNLPMKMRMQIGALTIGLGAFALNALTSNSFQHPQPAVFFWLLAGVLVAVVAEVKSDENALHEVGRRTSVSPLAHLAAGSVAIRVMSRIADTLGNWWHTSTTRAVLSAEKAHDSSILLSSTIARLLFGRASK